ncbi:MAG TPA: hypothetical protein VF251_07810 [Pyrinomonadaceae bacterium]
MIATLTIALLVTLGGTVATYLYDDTASFAARVCSGACLGLGILGLTGFVVSSFIGLTSGAVVIALLISSAPLLLLLSSTWRNAFQSDFARQTTSIRRFFNSPDRATALYVIFYLVVLVVFWKVFSRAMIIDPSGISTGDYNNFGDLPFHISVITGFAFGNNFPPEDPTYSGVSFTYPFISDFVAAIFVRCGASLQDSMFIENMMLAMSFIGLLHRWAWVLLRDRLAAIITPLLVILNGGFGWVLLFSKANENESGLMGVLRNLPPSLTVIPETTWRWGNAVSALLVPQRGFLMGLPLAIIVFTQWWLATDKEDEPEPPAKKHSSKDKRGQPVLPKYATPARRMVAAGVVAGLLPLVHAHTFVVVMVMSAVIALLIPRWREWMTFMVVASAIAIPQLLWSTSQTAVSTSSFFAWEVGWDHGQENPIWFWFKNTGFAIPLIVAAVLLRGEGYLVKKRLLFFYLPFTLCFIVPNFLKMAPWIWDNIKVLFYWWVASAPLVALLLARLWREGATKRVMAVVLFATLTLAGAIEVAGIAFRSVNYSLFDTAGIQFAEMIKQRTPPRSLIMHAPVHNNPVFLSGRRSLMGYPGHIWTHGLNFVRREGDLKRMYQGGGDADQLLQNYQIQYVVIGPLERLVMPVNEQFFSQYPTIGEVGEYKLYKVQRQ